MKHSGSGVASRGFGRFEELWKVLKIEDLFLKGTNFGDGNLPEIGEERVMALFLSFFAE